MKHRLLTVIVVAVTIPLTWAASTVLNGDAGSEPQPVEVDWIGQSFDNPCEAAAYGLSEHCAELGLPPSWECQVAYATGKASPDCPPVDYESIDFCVPDQMELKDGVWWSSVFQRPLKDQPDPLAGTDNLGGLSADRIITECFFR